MSQIAVVCGLRFAIRITNHKSQSSLRECENALYPRHGQTQNHGFSFGFQFPSLSVSKKVVVLVSGNRVVLVIGSVFA